MTTDPPKPFRLLMRIPVPWVFQLVFLAGTGLQFLLPAVRSPQVAIWSRAGGAVLLVAGVLLAAWSLLIFRRERTTTVPGAVSRALVVHGPYRFSRNPMYVALVLVYLGEVGVLVQIAPVFLLPFVVAYIDRIVIPVEESKLAEAFGDAYRRYRARVRRWM
jgi:protein-S-isoprenylcysteine O-methyltransferase Ste14